MSAPFIEPATDAELELMRQYLRRHDDALEWPFDWQNHQELTEKDDEGLTPNLPDWYDFYDGNMGTGTLMQLPDLRGPKEEVYLDLWRKERKRKYAEEQAINPTPPYIPPPPSIHCSLDERYKFAQTVDDDTFQRIFLHEIEQRNERLAAEKASGAWRADDIIILYLNNVLNPPPVRGGLNWRQAIVQCWYDYLSNLICEDIDMVRDEHAFYQETGLPMPVAEKAWSTGLDDDDDNISVYEQFAGYLLDGRELAGEPRDFNF